MADKIPLPKLRRVGRPCNIGIRFYERDMDRLQTVRVYREAVTGRPHSMSDVVLYLLDCFDNIGVMDSKVEETVSQME